MTDLSQLIVGDQRTREAPPAVAGVVERVDGAGVFVTVPEYDPLLHFGPCPYSGNAPAKGAECLVIFDDERQPWVMIPGASAMGTLVYANGTWPTRPASTSPILWIGPPRPPVGEGGAIVGLDMWLRI